MIRSLKADIAALQQLPETEPLEANFIDGGLCVTVSVGTIVSCAVIATCNKTQGSAPQE